MIVRRREFRGAHAENPTRAQGTSATFVPLHDSGCLLETMGGEPLACVLPIGIFYCGSRNSYTFGNLDALRVYHSGVDDPGGLGNGLGAVVDQAIEAVVLAHVAEEVLLRPSGEHRPSQARRSATIVRWLDRRLMAGVGLPPLRCGS